MSKLSELLNRAPISNTPELTAESGSNQDANSNDRDNSPAMVQRGSPQPPSLESPLQALAAVATNSAPMRSPTRPREHFLFPRRIIPKRVETYIQSHLSPTAIGTFTPTRASIGRHFSRSGTIPPFYESRGQTEETLGHYKRRISNPPSIEECLT